MNDETMPESVTVTISGEGNRITCDIGQLSYKQYKDGVFKYVPINEKRDELLERVKSDQQWSPEEGDFIISTQRLSEIIKEIYK